jgi:uncharacterized protein (DUF362 family)
MRQVVGDLPLELKGKKVLLKPNLVEYSASTPINTHPVFIHAVLEAVRAAGAAEVRIAEGPGHRRGTLDLAESAGHLATIPSFESLFTDLNLADVRLVDIPSPHSKLTSLYLPRILSEFDVLISLPKMKAHHWVGATLSMKNLFGIVPGGVYGWPKNVLHWAGLHECIADLQKVIPRHAAIVDGIVGMEGNGPIQGAAKQSGVIVAGADMVAVDSSCCRIMGIDPTKISYLTLAETRGQTAAGNVRQVGSPLRELRTDFQLLPVFQPWRLAGDA